MDNFGSALGDALSLLLRLGGAALIWYLARDLAASYEPLSKGPPVFAYARVAAACAVLAFLSWANYGTHLEDADPIYAGGERVADFEPTNAERDQHGFLVFFTLVAIAFHGTWCGRKRSREKRERREVEHMTANTAGKDSAAEGNLLKSSLLQTDPEQLQAAYDLVSKYGAVLEQGHMLDSADRLPASKEAIKAALLKVAKAELGAGTLSDQLLQHLRVGYGSLANFVSAEAAENFQRFSSTTLPTNPTYAEIDAEAKRISALDVSWRPVFERSTGEFKDLVAEFDQFLARFREK